MLKKNQSVICIQKILLLQKDLSQGVLSDPLQMALWRALTGVRVDRWKFVLAAQRAKQQAVWRELFVELRLPLIFDL